MKRLFTFYLVSVLLLCVVFCVPSAMALTQIEDVQVTIQQPVAGQKPAFTAQIPNGSHCTVDRIRWFRGTTGTFLEELTQESTFSIGQYVVCIYLKPDSGYALPGVDGSMGSIHINGGTCWSWSHNTATFAVEYRGNFNVEATAQLGKVTVFTEEAIVGKTPDPNKVSTNP